MSSAAIAAEPGAGTRPRLIAQPDVPRVIATVGTVELVDTLSCGPRDAAADERVSIARELVTSDAQSAAAARERLVRAHLSVFYGPAAEQRADFAQEEFQAQRAGLRAARLDLARAEDLDDAACARPDPSAMAGRAAGATLEVRMELPAPLLRPLQQALIYDSDQVLIYPGGVLDRSAPPVVGRLASVESTLHGNDPIVVVRVRVADSSSRLRNDDIVAVDLKLDREATAAADTPPLTAATR